MTLSGLSGSAFGSGVFALRAQVLHNVAMVECRLTDGLAAQNGHAESLYTTVRPIGVHSLSPGSAIGADAANAKVFAYFGMDFPQSASARPDLSPGPAAA